MRALSSRLLEEPSVGRHLRVPSSRCLQDRQRGRAAALRCTPVVCPCAVPLHVRIRHSSRRRPPGLPPPAGAPPCGRGIPCRCPVYVQQLHIGTTRVLPQAQRSIHIFFHTQSPIRTIVLRKKIWSLYGRFTCDIHHA